MENISFEQIVRAIRCGAVDDRETQIIDEINARRRFMSSMTAAELSLNQRVKISGISPKWLNGLTGKIVALPYRANSKRFDVELDAAADDLPLDRYGREQSKVQRGIPAGCLTAL